MAVIGSCCEMLGLVLNERNSTCFLIKEGLYNFILSYTTSNGNKSSQYELIYIGRNMCYKGSYSMIQKCKFE